MTPGGYFGRALVVDVGSGEADRLDLPERVLRGYIGGVGLGTWLMHRLAPAEVDPLGPDAPLAFVLLPAGRHAADDEREVRRRGEVAAHRPAQRRARVEPLRDRGQAHRATTRSSCAARAQEPSVLLVDGDGRAARADADDLVGPVGGRRRGAPARAARPGLARRGDRPGGRAAGALRHGLARRPPRRPRRARRGAGRQAHQGRRRARRRRQAARRRPARPSLAAAKDLRERSFGPATAKYRELGTLANLLAFNAIATLPDAQLPGRRPSTGRRGSPPRTCTSCAPVARNSCASCTIGCEHIYAAQGGGTHARGVRERVRARAAVRGVRPRRRARGERAAATSSASTRSPRAARSPGRWSAPSAA